MNQPMTPNPSRPMSAIPQLARVDWLYYVLIGGRVLCGLWLLVFLAYGWAAWSDYRVLAAAVPADGAAPGALVRIEGPFSSAGPAKTEAANSREAIAREGLARDFGLSSYWHARLVMFRKPRKSGPFHERIVNLDVAVAQPFAVTPAAGRPVFVSGTPTKLYGALVQYRYEPPYLEAHVDAGPSAEAVAVVGSSGFVQGVISRGVASQTDRLEPHPQFGLILSGKPHAVIARDLALRLFVSLVCIVLLAAAALKTRRYPCLDRALARPAQFCVFEVTGGSETVAVMSILAGLVASFMLISPPPTPEHVVYALHAGLALLLAGVVLGAGRVEFFYVANKADRGFYAVNCGMVSATVTKIMDLAEFNPKVRFEDVATRYGMKTNHYIETAAPGGSTLIVSDRFRDSVGPAEILTEYERFQKTALPVTTVEVSHLIG